MYTRTVKTLNKMKTNPDKMDSCLISMGKSIEAGFVEQIPQEEIAVKDEVWYMPIFCVEQVKKHKYRLVFDGKYRYEGVGINDALYQGPDLNSQLRSVLLRLRERPIGYAADISSMFNNFAVPEEQQNLLRFYWFEGNNPNGPIVPFRSRCHIFGLTSSPAVAAFALKFCAASLGDSDPLTRDYLERGYYVDDGLSSSDTSSEAIQVLSGAIDILKSFRMRLHKIVSNSSEVLDFFPESECAMSITSLPSDAESTALGVQWDTGSDEFWIKPDIPERPFTKRGVLSAISSIYDPIGITCSISLMGRIIQREILTSSGELSAYGWDDPLPDSYYPKWQKWLQSLSGLSELKIPRSFYPLSFVPVVQELHSFSDASDQGLGCVWFMRSISASGEIRVAFVGAVSRIAPKAAISTPRLELCAGVELAKGTARLKADLRQKPDKILLYTDSRIILGYITNDDRRFSKYVERRKQSILNMSSKDDWRYVSTMDNPADTASRPVSPQELKNSSLLRGPDFLWDPVYSPVEPSKEEDFKEMLPEEKIEASVLHTREIPASPSIFSSLLNRISGFNRLVRVVMTVHAFIRKFDGCRTKMGAQISKRSEVPSKEECIMDLVKTSQAECYPDTLRRLRAGQCLPENHKISELAPQLDANSVIRVGGRLKNSNLSFSVKHPILLPKDHPLSWAIARHYHQKSKHQGVHISHATLIQAGYHIEKGKQLIKVLVSNCVICRRLRAKLSTQIMADLPAERVEDCPIFTHVGIDAFGHFLIYDGKSTRRNSASKKVWVLIIVCLPSRACHLEPLSSMDITSFRHAFSRFAAVRGMCRAIYCDRGTNFMGTNNQMEVSLSPQELSAGLAFEGVEWRLNPAQGSHFGGHYERRIGLVRKVLDASFMLVNDRPLSREEFQTFLSEASSVVNNTPLWALSDNPNDPVPLSPSMLMTLKEVPNPPSIEIFTEKDILAYGPRRYRRVQALSEEFWRRWKNEYLQELQRRSKWRKAKPSLKKGDLVLVRNKNVSRNKWNPGKITSVKLSKDERVRSATLIIPPLPGSNKNRTTEKVAADLVLLMPNKHEIETALTD